nr:probable membrane-associated kinase regulator 3 [Ipomoea batatas]
MAVDVCCEVSSLVVSPRISFSYDLKESDRMIITPVPESHPLISTIDFDFRITTDQIFSSADELFANGKILPVDLKKSTPPKPSSSSSTNEPTKRHMLKELLSLSSANSSEQEKPPPSKPPFWQFKRSFSLNCENGSSNNSLLRSLQFLSRSNSTGSAQNLRPPVLPRPIQRRNSKKEPPPLATRAASSCGGHPLRSSSKKSSSPLKKSRSGRAYGSLKISPVLNIPPAYISKAALFGLSSLFCNAKSKNKKK